MAKSAERKQNHLARMFRFQQGKCAVCGQPAHLEDVKNPPIRFRIGSSYGKKGRVRPKVMAHRLCAQERSDQITLSQPLDELRRRSGRHGDVYEALPLQDGQEGK